MGVLDKMKKQRRLKIKDGDFYSSDSLTLSDLDGTGKCHILTSSYGEVASASLTKTEVKKTIKWLTKWIEIKDNEDNNRRNKK